VLAAVSGGADSSALALLLARSSARPLVLAHVRHGFRPGAAAAELAQVKELARRLAAPLHVVELEPPREWRPGGRIPEAAARARRYAALAEVARRSGLPVVATAHHACDRRETQLLHLLRGGGLRALAGMAGVRRFAGLWLWRPLLDLEPEELRESLRASGWSWIEDESNLDLRLARNRVRHVLVPELRRRGDPLLERADRLARLARRALDRIEALLSGRLAPAPADAPARGTILPLATARSLAPVLVRELLECAARRVLPDAALRARRRELLDVAEWLRAPDPRGRRSIGSLTVRRWRRWLLFASAGDAA
jgi:tRNA(Ile)-lysidine synthase